MPITGRDGQIGKKKITPNYMILTKNKFKKAGLALYIRANSEKQILPELRMSWSQFINSR